MHFHLPKPLHGWRALAGEIGIIVVGVLIALGADQIVQEVHEGQVKRETIRAAKVELAAALGNFVNRRLQEPCIIRRLDEVSGLVSASVRPGYQPPSWIGRPQLWGFDSAAWDGATAGGRVPLLSQDQQAGLGSLYGQLHDLASLERGEQQEWADIRQLEGLAEVDPQTRSSVRSALSRARLLNWNINVDLEQTISRAKKMGIVGKLVPKGASPSICLPLNTPRAEAVRRVDTFFGDNLGEP